MTPEINQRRSRLFVVFLLTFASLADLIAPLTIGEGFMGIVKTFFILGLVFVLQETFKWIRIIVSIILSALCVFALVAIIFNNGRGIIYFLVHTLFIPSTMPLYFSLLIVGFFTYLFLRNYDLTR